MHFGPRAVDLSLFLLLYPVASKILLVSVVGLGKDCPTSALAVVAAILMLGISIES